MKSHHGEIIIARLGLALGLLSPTLILAADGGVPATQDSSISHLNQLRETLTELREDVASASLDEGGVSNAATEIDRLIGQVDQMILEPEALMEGGVAGGGTPPIACFVEGDQARIIMHHSAALLYADKSFGMTLIGNKGMHQFTLTTSLTLQQMMAVINEVTPQTGVQATPNTTWWLSSYVFNLVSVAGGEDQFVAAFVTTDPISIFQQTSGALPLESGALDYGTPSTVPWSATP